MSSELLVVRDDVADQGFTLAAEEVGEELEVLAVCLTVAPFVARPYAPRHHTYRLGASQVVR